MQMKDVCCKFQECLNFLLKCCRSQKSEHCRQKVHSKENHNQSTQWCSLEYVLHYNEEKKNNKTVKSKLSGKNKLHVNKLQIHVYMHDDFKHQYFQPLEFQ